MKAEDWNYITTNWGSEDEITMNKIAEIKQNDAAERQKLETELEEHKKKVEEVTQRNIDLNRTNMDLVLRLTDPNNSPTQDDIHEEYRAPAIDDYDSFIKD